ncbi:hypothetical protein HN018_12095 [Lichenicola cladoniae]|uniref:Uncharacterized protein n=1 Tax=Lichenicola cladoniae TaxID=1484109 RepID=A0A6M8HQW8_9PROT|nr:hypothetical protein [Lichenicola cladoniae]NPD68105.1 hypothetical protein [Acetobacteraceae bacterium]QKE90676.1 hypothetical protein HN018_12095 [Lichenicola cladoniae]
MSHPISLSPSVNPSHRCATRLLTMVHEFHKAGYQRIRFSSGMAPSGIYWRCSITHAGNMTADGLHIQDYNAPEEVAAYSSSSGDHYFGWADAPGRSARELGLLFLDRFPAIAEKGLGRDWTYAGWLTEILGRAERDERSGFPVFFADYPIDLEPADRPPPVTIGMMHE